MAASELVNKVVLITGAGSGLGRAISTQFAAHGCRLCLVDIDPDTIKASADICKERGAKDSHVSTIVCDLSVENSIKTTADRALATFGKVNILVNNAGRFLPTDGSLHRITGEILEEQFNLMVKAPILMTHYLLPTLTENRGCVINTASIAGLVSSPGMLAYSVCKAAVVNFTRLSAKELAPFVRVNSICPGPIETKIMDESRGFSTKRKNHLREKMKTNIPMRRLGEAEEVGRAALYLARETFVTGTNLVVDGGVTLPLYNETIIPRNMSKV